MKKSLISLVFALLAFSALPIVAQESKDEKPQAKPPQPVYKLEFSVYELQDGKRTNARKYLMFLKGGGPSGDTNRSLVQHTHGACPARPSMWPQPRIERGQTRLTTALPGCLGTNSVVR